MRREQGYSGVDPVKVKHRPGLLSDNGSAYLSSQLREYLDDRKMKHTRAGPYHPLAGALDQSDMERTE